MQVRERGGDIAVIDGPVQLTYGELNCQANRLAHYLRDVGIGSHSLVGVSMQRSWQLIVALLAIVKAGGAYVPLDPEYPRERLSFLLEDTAAPAVLTLAGASSHLPPTSACVLPLDHISTAVSACPYDNLESESSPEALACVLYTSGSTGEPKGVMVPQCAVVRLVINTDFIQIAAFDRVAHSANTAFDAATFEIWGALLNGARLIIVSNEVLLSATALASEIREHGITTMFLPTALFNEYGMSSPGIFGGLEHLVFGGEVVDPKAVHRVLRATPPKRLINGYGPTEATTFALWYEIPRTLANSDTPPRSIPIGRPLANTRVYILDEQLRPVPAGAGGEIHLEGIGLARGYLNAPELTAQKFIANPFGESGSRLYKTGDLGRWNAEDEIEYLGRTDQQVKLRGFRIDLGEIESTLRRCKGVGECVVLIQELAPGNKRLIACVAPAASGEPQTSELRAALHTHLPAYAVPSALVFVDSIPLTPNGKLDREALSVGISTGELHIRSLQPQPVGAADSAQCRSVRDDEGLSAIKTSPDDLEQDLQRLWQGSLGVGAVGLDEDFFAIGGHSLIALRLLAEIEQKFGCTLPLSTLVHAPTVRQQAALLRLKEPKFTVSSIVPIRATGTRAPLFFVSGWGGAIVPFHALAREMNVAQPLYVLDLNAFADEGRGDLTLEAVATRMIQDLRRVQADGPYHLAGYSLGGKVVYEIAQQLQRVGHAVALLALLDCPAPGYTRLRSIPARVLLHIKHALGLRPREARAYLLERVRRLKKNDQPGEPRLFQAEDPLHATRLVRAMEQSALAMYRASHAYVPQPYPGRMVLIRAQIRDLGFLDDDPQQGWGARRWGRRSNEPELRPHGNPQSRAFGGACQAVGRQSGCAQRRRHGAAECVTSANGCDGHRAGFMTNHSSILATWNDRHRKRHPRSACTALRRHSQLRLRMPSPWSAGMFNLPMPRCFSRSSELRRGCARPE